MRSDDPGEDVVCGMLWASLLCSSHHCDGVDPMLCDVDVEHELSKSVQESSVS